MAESANGADGNDADSGGSDEYDYVTLTSAEVLEKLEEVSDTQIPYSMWGWGNGNCSLQYSRLGRTRGLLLSYWNTRQKWSTAF